VPEAVGDRTGAEVNVGHEWSWERLEESLERENPDLLDLPSIT
jgi:hypothetical protein